MSHAINTGGTPFRKRMNDARDGMPWMQKATSIQCFDESHRDKNVGGELMVLMNSRL